MADAILVLNAGSSSLKFSVFLNGDLPRPLLRGQLEGILTQPRFAADAGRRDPFRDDVLWGPESRAQLKRDGPGQGGAGGVGALPGVRAGAERDSRARPFPGTIKTRAAGGLKDFDLLLNEATRR